MPQIGAHRLDILNHSPTYFNRFPISATVPVGQQWSVLGPALSAGLPIGVPCRSCRSGGWEAVLAGLLSSLKGAQGQISNQITIARNRSHDVFFYVFALQSSKN